MKVDFNQIKTTISLPDPSELHQHQPHHDTRKKPI